MAVRAGETAIFLLDRVEETSLPYSHADRYGGTHRRYSSEEGVSMEVPLRLTRRTFVAWVGGASAGFYLFGRLPGSSAPTALAQIPGGSLDPTTVAKFQTPLLIPPVMPRAGTIRQPGGKPIDYYEISMKQFGQQVSRLACRRRRCGAMARRPRRASADC